MARLPDQLSVGLLATGQLCLTFDDGPGKTSARGPGPRTAAVAEYLASIDVVATFFMCGAHVDEHPEVVRTVIALGHQVGNHTYAHPSLPELSDGDIRGELLRATDALVRAGVELPVPFRPSYGAWDARCAAAVNAEADLVAALTGAYGWDLGGGDYEYWASGAPDGRAAANEVVEDALLVGSGVVLMHDSSADPGEDGVRLRAGNRTFEAVTMAVPELRRRGFVFVPLPRSAD
jgi:peptidoglycan/xylan/chitin deacetylase (PgdA/CDA1 family)